MGGMTYPNRAFGIRREELRRDPASSLSTACFESESRLVDAEFNRSQFEVFQESRLQLIAFREAMRELARIPQRVARK